MAVESLILVVNPGSASRKYAVFRDDKKIAQLHFEFVESHVECTFMHEGQRKTIAYEDNNLLNVSRYVFSLLDEHDIINENNVISAIGIRVAAPSQRFAQDALATEEVIKSLESIQQKAPLHISVALVEIKNLVANMKDVPIVIVSDSAFHSTKPEYAQRYAIDVDLADKIDVKRFGYHGLSAESVIDKLETSGKLKPKTIVCHLGSGSSITAVRDGKSIETTMGYSPLEGLMMSTRSGTIDISAALAIKHELDLDDIDLENFLNKKSGLLGVSGSSDDIRQLLVGASQDNERAQLALDMFVYRIKQAIGQMAAAMDGVDNLVFTATIGERSAPIRSRILDGLGYLGFSYNQELNNKLYEPTEITNIANEPNKPILVVATDEFANIARHAYRFINSNN